jgi:TonB family protein
VEVPLNRILAQRRTGLRLWRGRRSAILSLALHLAVVAALFLGPLLLADRPKPVEYVQVTIVPAASLPRPAPPPKPRPEPPKPRREEPKPKPPPEDAPVLPSPEKPEPEPPPPQEAGSAETEEESAPNVGPAREGPATVQGLDDPTFTYGYYVDRMLSLIRARWQRPPVGGDVEVVVHFRILRNGHVDQVRIVTPSGIDAFDLAGLRAIQAASPLPPLPQGYRKSSLGVTLIMR